MKKNLFKNILSALLVASMTVTSMTVMSSAASTDSKYDGDVVLVGDQSTYGYGVGYINAWVSGGKVTLGNTASLDNKAVQLTYNETVPKIGTVNSTTAKEVIWVCADGDSALSTLQALKFDDFKAAKKDTKNYTKSTNLKISKGKLSVTKTATGKSIVGVVAVCKDGKYRLVDYIEVKFKQAPTNVFVTAPDAPKGGKDNAVKSASAGVGQQVDLKVLGAADKDGNTAADKDALYSVTVPAKSKGVLAFLTTVAPAEAVDTTLLAEEDGIEITAVGADGKSEIDDIGFTYDQNTTYYELEGQTQKATYTFKATALDAEDASKPAEAEAGHVKADTLKISVNGAAAEDLTEAGKAVEVEAGTKAQVDIIVTDGDDATVTSTYTIVIKAAAATAIDDSAKLDGTAGLTLKTWNGTKETAANFEESTWAAGTLDWVYDNTAATDEITFRLYVKPSDAAKQAIWIQDDGSTFKKVDATAADGYCHEFKLAKETNKEIRILVINGEKRAIYTVTLKGTADAGATTAARGSISTSDADSVLSALTVAEKVDGEAGKAITPKSESDGKTDMDFTTPDGVVPGFKAGDRVYTITATGNNTKSKTKKVLAYNINGGTDVAVTNETAGEVCEPFDVVIPGETETIVNIKVEGGSVYSIRFNPKEDGIAKLVDSVVVNEGSLLNIVGTGYDVAKSKTSKASVTVTNVQSGKKANVSVTVGNQIVSTSLDDVLPVARMTAKYTDGKKEGDPKVLSIESASFSKEDLAKMATSSVDAMKADPTSKVSDLVLSTVAKETLDKMTATTDTKPSIFVTETKLTEAQLKASIDTAKNKIDLKKSGGTASKVFSAKLDKDGKLTVSAKKPTDTNLKGCYVYLGYNANINAILEIPVGVKVDVKDTTVKIKLGGSDVEFKDNKATIEYEKDAKGKLNVEVADGFSATYKLGAEGEVTALTNKTDSDELTYADGDLTVTVTDDLDATNTATYTITLKQKAEAKA